MRFFGLGGDRQPTDLEPLAELEVVEPEPAPLELDVIAYAEDCVLTGRLALAGDRLSDFLNAGHEFQLLDVSAQDLAGNSPLDAPEIVIDRDEILLVQATGPRGNPDRRVNTRQNAIRVRIGPYVVSGLIHSLPGIDPIESLRRKRPLFAMTEATIEYSTGSVPKTVQVDAVIVNRECVDSIVEAYPPRADETFVAVTGAPEQLALLA